MEEKLIIRGGNRLTGTIAACGAKNAAVAILPAAMLAESPCTIENLPDILDVHLLNDISSQLGATVDFDPQTNTCYVDPSMGISHEATFDSMRDMRASYYYLGALLGRFGKASIALPGGCPIGQRPIDLHLKGMTALGADVEIRQGVVEAVARDGKLYGADIYLDVVSVGATANIMMAAAKAEGWTTILNAAKEPHVVDLANFLNSMGAHIKGAGTDVIRIQGVDALHGCDYAIIPDQIETGTLMVASAATKGDVTITNVIPFHMESVTAKLLEMGVHVEEKSDSLRVWTDERPKRATIKTVPYPGFPTDLQQPITPLLCVAEGTSLVVENIFEDRFKHLGMLERMGAKSSVSGRVAVIEGVDFLEGAPVEASDLRAGACLIIAGLMAQGETHVTGLHHIDRGYARLEEKLISLGADIKRVPIEE
ncbi:UDP-N-acetylglucosamine 1-carboxyvinyltransferase [Eubacteriales bacterium OttesenSCG-928-M02]|nr:UDP-N-acetylglucosamine 1-carboxyvinyltransferase [Eubacteriales bacterium OttesenSCG-928-M02]